MRQWLVAVLVLAATTAWAQTGRVGPPKSEFKDGPFFVSWHYVTPSSGMVYVTPKLKSSDSPRFTVGESFELNITLRIAPGTENPCDLRIGSPRCEMEARMVFIDTSGIERVRAAWTESVALTDALHTFHLVGTVAADVPEARGYIDLRFHRGGKPVLGFNCIPFRVKRP